MKALLIIGTMSAFAFFATAHAADTKRPVKNETGSSQAAPSPILAHQEKTYQS
jgi:hypothetical protein